MGIPFPLTTLRLSVCYCMEKVQRIHESCYCTYYQKWE